MSFRAIGSTYNVRVRKGRSKTILHGHQWEQLITANNLSQGDMLVFSMKPSPPRISVAMVYNGNNREDSAESSTDDEISDSSEEEDDMSSADEADDDDRIVVAQRARLTTHEKNRLAQLLPVGRYVGLLFVTRLTSTNLRRHDMVCVPIRFPFLGSFPYLIFKNHEPRLSLLYNYVIFSCTETT